MKDNSDRLFDAIENSSGFSDDEIREILADPNIRELYNHICKTADTLTTTNEPDIDLEWERFKNRHCESAHPGFINSFRNFLTRNAAAVLFCAIASLAVVAATLGVAYSFSRLQEPPESMQNLTEIPDGVGPEALSGSDSVPVGSTLSEVRKTMILKDEPFDSVISSIADFYGVSIEYKSENPKELRMYFHWDRSLPLGEVVEQLNNFEQIKLRIADSTIIVE